MTAEPTPPSSLIDIDYSEIEKRVMANHILKSHPLPFNGLTLPELERLGMLAEEAAEVGQMVGKIIRFGYHSTHPDGGPTNRELLVGEILDMLAVLSMMDGKELGNLIAEHLGVTPEDRVARKQRYSHHQ